MRGRFYIIERRHQNDDTDIITLNRCKGNIITQSEEEFFNYIKDYRFKEYTKYAIKFTDCFNIALYLNKVMNILSRYRLIDCIVSISEVDERHYFNIEFQVLNKHIGTFALESI